MGREPVRAEAFVLPAQARAETADAIFAKSLDRVQPVMHNIESGGGSWIEYNVTADQLEQRVGAKVARGAPALWTYVLDRTRHFFG